MNASTQLLHFDINYHPLLITSTNDYHPTHLPYCNDTNRQHLKMHIVALTGSTTVSYCKPYLRQVMAAAGGVPLPPLDLTEDNIRQVLEEARVELAQLFDTSVGMTGEVELAELDGPFVKISLRGRFWHKRSTVLARVGNYLKQRIPEILEVEIEDEKQLDDSPENF